MSIRIERTIGIINGKPVTMPITIHGPYAEGDQAFLIEHLTKDRDYWLRKYRRQFTLSHWLIAIIVTCALLRIVSMVVKG